MSLRLLSGILFFFLCGCSSLMSLFERSSDQKEIVATNSSNSNNETKRTTRKSLEEESMLGESTGSLWMGRGQQAYLFTNNNQRLLGDLLNIKIEGYPKEQIQTKINTISKLLAEILGEQKQEIEFKQNELKKQLVPPEEKTDEEPALMRGLASTDEKEAPTPEQIQQELNQNNKKLKTIGDESEEIAQLKSAKDLPIKTIPTRIVEIQKDGDYRVRGEQPFMIGKREYKLLVMGTVRSEDYNEQGVSAEVLIDPVFDIISDKKIEAL